MEKRKIVFRILSPQKIKDRVFIQYAHQHSESIKMVHVAIVSIQLYLMIGNRVLNLNASLIRSLKKMVHAQIALIKRFQKIEDHALTRDVLLIKRLMRMVRVRSACIQKYLKTKKTVLILDAYLNSLFEKMVHAVIVNTKLSLKIRNRV